MIFTATESATFPIVCGLYKYTEYNNHKVLLMNYIFDYAKCCG